MSSHTSRARALTAVVVAAGAALLFPATASAHVTVSPATAEPGGYARVVFRVPNERDDASTNRLEVVLPTEHRFASVSVQPVPGWTATTRTEKLDPPVKVGDRELTEAVTAIVWEGGEVAPGQFQEFPVSLGRLPQDERELVFKALQTYSGGEVVRWIDTPAEGTSEADHPAPKLSVKAGAVASAPAPAAGADPLGRVLGGAGLVAGLAALGLAAVRRGNRSAPARTRPAEKVTTRV
ncbi:DUF1775 domain-containing protein [Saccharothrix syringae]|uniref:DUF1775 domain-containing protein n=2 Tax=Saccharothrix syringae TaxID=103733 RepID=A0A5Q0GXL5_SACSY|nr:DUF1775 domain-containing protein [Saccharothrix syringae]